jgi:hypothetical protein
MKTKSNNKKVRKHRGIHQTGGKAGKLKKGYKYSGKKLKNGKAEIIKVQIGGPNKRGNIKRSNTDDRLKEQLLNEVYIITPLDRYKDWKLRYIKDEMEINNHKDKKNKYTLSRDEFRKRIEEMEEIRPKIVEYEKKFFTKYSMEIVNLYNLEQTEQKISEIREKISGINKFITEVEIGIRLLKLLDKNLGKKPQLLEDAKVSKEEKYVNLAIFTNRKITLEDEERRRNQQMERAFQQSTQQVIAKKNKKKTLMVGGVIDELPLNIPESLEKIIYAKKIKEEIVSMKESYKNTASTNQHANVTQTIWFELLLSSGIPISDVAFLNADTLNEDKFDALIDIYSSEPIKNYQLKSLLKINKKMKQIIENPTNPNFVPGRELTLEERFEILMAGL